ncbi:N-acetyl-gamma-glutamyl-phosphate reductase [Chloroherpeton thalassium]|uniref:N-acetyl-gamma-glutamyl-phosphate reductase n=1 Tax=Chloroherpeton thalassium TaxID=100716 RepID=UPI00059DCB8A|nr:N-acetyl-gamma-glutamyl-phosphate reductase [Chloroherpeton thalassium]
MKQKVSIIGASGYSGSELTRLLSDHPAVEILHLYAHGQAGKKAAEVYPYLETDLTYETYEGDLSSNIYFLALPHGEALKLVPDLLKAGKKVIDLSGDFRIHSVSVHEKYYKNTKPEGSTLQYGQPELFKEDIKKATAISNPGCYATSITLALAPILTDAHLKAETESVTVNALSGMSGAGRSSKTIHSFSEMSGNVWAYKIGVHQHSPEILQNFGLDIACPPFPFTFVPMVAPLVRGIYTTTTVKLKQKLSLEEAHARFRDFYKNEPFVRIKNEAPEIRGVAYTNYCDIGIQYCDDFGNIVIISAIDNLIKGAAGQAIQNMNLMLGLSEETALKSGFFGQ